MDNLILGKKPPLIREVAAMIFGLVFVLTGGYSALETIFGLFCVPFLYAGVIRLIVVFYRLFVLVFASPLICSVLSLIAFGCVVTALTGTLKFSVVMGMIIIIALAIAEAWFFVRDVKVTLRHREYTKNQHD